VNIAVSPRSDLQFEEGNQLKQALRYPSIYLFIYLFIYFDLKDPKQIVNFLNIFQAWCIDCKNIS